MPEERSQSKLLLRTDDPIRVRPPQCSSIFCVEFSVIASRGDYSYLSGGSSNINECSRKIEKSVVGSTYVAKIDITLQCYIGSHLTFQNNLLLPIDATLSETDKEQRYSYDKRTYDFEPIEIGALGALIWTSFIGVSCILLDFTRTARRKACLQGSALLILLAGPWVAALFAFRIVHGDWSLTGLLPLASGFLVFPQGFGIGV